jgi:hypothetical protein
MKIDMRLEYSAKLVTQCEQMLAKVTGQEIIQLSRKPEKRMVGTFYVNPLYGNNIFCDPRDDEDRGAWELVQIKAPTVWPAFLGFRLRFDHEETKDVLTSSSILIVINFGGLKPIFRAEWDYRGICEGSTHAQPHWHALLDEVPITSGISSGSGLVKEFGNEENRQTVKLSLIHLPMATNWHEVGGKTFIHSFMCVSSLTNWLNEVSLYIKGQLEYLRKKHGELVIEEFSA